MSENQNSNSFVKGLFVGLLLALLTCFCGFGIYRVVISTQTKAAAAKQEAKESAEATEVGEERLKINNRIEQKMRLVEKVVADYYYQDEYDVEAMESGIYRGMIDSLGDPYSQYFNKEELEKLNKETEGYFFGIGATLTIDEDTGFGMIKEVKEGSAAEEGGVQNGDLIYKVDGVSTYGLSLSEIVSMVRGEENTTVVLTMVRDSANDFIDLTITRRRFNEVTVTSKMFDNKIGYIQIKEFDVVTRDQFAENLEMLKADGMQALILDLRSNPGGSLSIVTDIARMILPEGLIVYTEDRNGKRQEHFCDGTQALKMPMYVLINGASASASEILSGAIKDHGVGTLLGTKTFGKGVVQRVIGLSDGSAVKITISSYFTPNGTNIHGIGIEPDIECVFDAKSYYNNQYYDNQLEKARELLSEELGVEYVAPENAPIDEKDALAGEETENQETEDQETVEEQK